MADFCAMADLSTLLGTVNVNFRYFPCIYLLQTGDNLHNDVA